MEDITSRIPCYSPLHCCVPTNTIEQVDQKHIGKGRYHQYNKTSISRIPMVKTSKLSPDFCAVIVPQNHIKFHFKKGSMAKDITWNII